uniref:olfactomedin-like protein 2A isoform X2 n=1 Tax=Myxine glutinosa TaxID=7769 RepID=UPI00358E4163
MKPSAGVRLQSHFALLLLLLSFHSAALRARAQVGNKLLLEKDHVRSHTEGANCRCKCVVRPLARKSCEQQHGKPLYIVETISSGGRHCQCSCSAPSAALNPCEAEWRTERLQRNAPEMAKLSSLSNLLQSTLHGMDLLKLHSFIAVLVQQVVKLEEAMSANFSRESEYMRSGLARMADHMEQHANDSELIAAIRKDLANLSLTLQQRTFHAEEKENRGADVKPVKKGKSEKKMKKFNISQQRPQAKSSNHSWHSPVGHNRARPILLREVTYYTGKKKDGQLVHHKKSSVSSNTRHVARNSHRLRPTVVSTTTGPYPTTSRRIYSFKVYTTLTTTTPATVTKSYSISRTLSKEVKEAPTEKGPTCVRTLLSIHMPVSFNKYGRNEGAWMKDPMASDGRIFITNYYYGNNLVEFKNLENFKQGRWSSIHKLPYNWIGTGHVVYNGSFYYNRAFSRHIIKYNMAGRHMVAWALLPDAVYEETTPWRWRGHSDIDFAVDENGLWVIYPSLKEGTSRGEMITLSRLDPKDLSIHDDATWRTTLRKGAYGNCFVVCGVLYALDTYTLRNSTVFYAYDTYTSTQASLRVPLINIHGYVTQIDYNPREQALYAWDRGHQVVYNLTMLS